MQPVHEVQWISGQPKTHLNYSSARQTTYFFFFVVTCATTGLSIERNKNKQTARANQQFRPLWKPYRGVWKIRLAHRSLKWKPVDVLSGTHTDTWTLKRQTHTALLHCSFTFWAWCRTGCLQFREVWIEIPGTAVVDLEAREKYLWKYLVFITYICHKGLNLIWDQLSSDLFSLVGFQTFWHFRPMKTSGLLRFKGAFNSHFHGFTFSLGFFYNMFTCSKSTLFVLLLSHTDLPLLPTIFISNVIYIIPLEGHLSVISLSHYHYHMHFTVT